MLSVRLESPWDRDVALLSGWTEATFNPPGSAAASGFLFQQQHSRVDPGVIKSRDHLLGEFHIPVSVPVLDAVERVRTEQVALQLRCRFLIAPVVKVDEELVLGMPRETGVRTIKNDSLGIVISKSDWIRYLSAWRWADIELFELPFDRLRESPRFRRPFELLRNAEGRLRNGDHPGVLQSCRLVLESLAKDAKPEGDLAEGFQAVLEQSVRGQEVRLRLNELILGLSNLTHLARHEERPHEDITRPDAVFCLRCTLAVLARVIEPTG